MTTHTYKAIYILITSVIFATTGHSVTLRQDTWDNPEKRQESYDHAQNFTSVVNIGTEIWFNNQKLQTIHTSATGTIIAKNAILTAAHPFNDPVIQAYEKRGYEFKQYIETESTTGKKRKISVKKVHTPPSFNGLDSTVSHNDLAILELSKNIDTKLHEISELFRGNTEDIVGEIVYEAGYGNFGGSDESMANSEFNFNGKKLYFEAAYNSYTEAVNFDESLENIEEKPKVLATLYRMTPQTCPNCESIEATMRGDFEDTGNLGFNIEEDMSDFYGRSAIGDSGAGRFDKDGKVVRVISDGRCGLIKYVKDGNYITECMGTDIDSAVASTGNLNWIDTVLEKIGRNKNIFKKKIEQNYKLQSILVRQKETLSSC